MRAPIIAESDDVDIFESVQAAEAYLEPPDVRSGIRLYDRDSRPIRASIVQSGRFFGSEHVQLVEIEESAPAADEVRALLTRFLSGIKQLPEGQDSLSLDELWNRALPHKTR
jgi:hypothetical protein